MVYERSKIRMLFLACLRGVLKYGSMSMWVKISRVWVGGRKRCGVGIVARG